MKIKYLKLPLLEFIFVFLLMSDVFLPQIDIAGYGLTLSLVVSPLIFLISIYQKKEFGVRIWWQLAVVSAMGMMVFASAIWSYAMLNVPFSSRDFLEAIKYLKFLPYLVLVQSMDYAKFDLVIQRIFPLLAFYILTIGISQVLLPDSIGGVTVGLYASEYQSESISGANARILLTGSDPNVGAAIAVCFFFYCALNFLHSKRFLHALATVSFLSLIFLTQSRTAVVALAFSVVIFLLFVFDVSIMRRIVFLIGSLVLFYLLYLAVNYYNLEYIIIGFESILTGDNSSTNIRVNNFREALSWFSESVLFGYGPAKAIHPTVIDSEYALIIGRYGLVGIAIFLMYLFFYTQQCVTVWKKYRINTARELDLIYISILFISFSIVLMITNNLFSGYQLMALPVLFASGIHLLREKKRKHSVASGVHARAQR
jgi:O-antigen ligase